MTPNNRIQLPNRNRRRWLMDSGCLVAAGLIGLTRKSRAADSKVRIGMTPAFLHDQHSMLGEWRAFMEQSVSQQDIEETWLPRYYAEDRPAPLLDQLEWLTRIGFHDVDVVWKYYNVAVPYGGRRS